MRRKTPDYPLSSFRADVAAEVRRGRRDRLVAVLLYVVLIANLAYLVRQVADANLPRSCFGDPVEAAPPAPQPEPTKKGQLV